MERFWKEKDAYLESTRKKRCLLLNSKGEYIRCPKCNKCEGCERPEKDQYLSRYISLDKFMDDNSDDDTNRSGWEPTDNTSTENSVLSLMMIDDLINEVSLKYPEAKAISSLLMDDPQISNALKQVNLKKGKSQAYDYVKKMQYTGLSRTPFIKEVANASSVLFCRFFFLYPCWFSHAAIAAIPILV